MRTSGVAGCQGPGQSRSSWLRQEVRAAGVRSLEKFEKSLAELGHTAAGELAAATR